MEQKENINRTLVVFTKNFGVDFSGATIATCNLLNYFVKDFKEVIVLCQNVGCFTEQPNLIIQQYSNLFNGVSLLRDMPNDAVFLSDDHYGFILSLARKKYYHIYHGNWPNAMFLDLSFFIKGLFFLPIYIFTIRKAFLVFNVSFFMEKFCRIFNKNTALIRNGVGQNIEFNSSQFILSKKVKILMVGNVDVRKYKSAVRIFEQINHKRLSDFYDITIYGNIKDQKLAKKLEIFDFVKIVGFQSIIEYHKYDLYLSTSYFENLSIAVCEALLSGRPVFAFNVGGLNEVVKQYDNGYLAPVKDIEAILKNLELFRKGELNLKPTLAPLREFSWEISSSRYLTYFRRSELY